MSFNLINMLKIIMRKDSAFVFLIKKLESRSGRVVEQKEGLYSE